MSLLASTDLILFGVVALVALNRLFESSRLSRYRSVYVVVQAVDFATVVLLSVIRIEEFEGRVELVIRLFLMLFVTFHMVRNSQVRAKAVQREGEAARADAERARLRAAAAEAAAQAGEEAEPLSDAPPPG